MTFLFFTAANVPIFTRSDAESAVWTVEEMGLQCLFPYDPDKVIQRGQIIGFPDDTGAYQAFEIRKVRTYEPDHYQEIWAEHIAISQLTDEHFGTAEWTNITASAALTALLAGTGWSVGNVTASGTSSADISMGSVWQDVRTIEKNWNVYITPRIVLGASGITGRYLDIAPAQGTWRGIRLALDKNADEIGVTIDDTSLVTALYGYGRNVETSGATAPLTFGSVVWTATADHPAKPSGQTYIEDPAATAAYGRNGRPRFGFYQNGDISDPNVLLEKTWEALRISTAPTVTIDCMVRDLYRLGYADQPIRLHDTAIVEIKPTGTKLQLEIIRLVVDLIDPTATRPTIGAYIPNIIYIDREISNHATGGGGGRGQTNLEKEITEFNTEITANAYQISLRAYQLDMDNVENILAQAGMEINSQGVLIYAENNPNMVGAKFKVLSDSITSIVTKTGINSLGQNETLYSEITQNADSITSLVSKTGVNSLGQGETLYSEIQQNATEITTKVSAGAIASTINQTAQSVLIEAQKINLSGYVTANQLSAEIASIHSEYADYLGTDRLVVETVGTILGRLSVNGGFNIGSNSGFTFHENSVSWQQEWVATSASTTTITYLDAAYMSHTQQVATGTYGKYIYFLGRTVSS